MADQVEVTKLNQLVAIGPLTDNIAVSKLVMYVLLEPGDGGEEVSTRQGHVHAQIVRRR
jgi:hypothetical protein